MKMIRRSGTRAPLMTPPPGGRAGSGLSRSALAATVQPQERHRDEKDEDNPTA
jgi:hypothetical protein